MAGKKKDPLPFVYEPVVASTPVTNTEVIRERRKDIVGETTFELRINEEDGKTAQLWATYTIDGEERQCHLLSLVPGKGIVLQPDIDAEIFPVDAEGFLSWTV